MRLPARPLLRHSVAAAILLLSPVLVAQAPTPPPPSEPALTTLHARANLVLVDVVVTDAHGNPVKGLEKDAFSLTEDKTPQMIRTFDEHTAPHSDAKFTEMPKLLPGYYTNYTPAPVNSAVNILLLDSLNTPMQNQAMARQQVLKYLKEMKPGTAVAVFNLSTGLKMLHGFTADQEVLEKVVDAWRPLKSPLLDERTGGSPPSMPKGFDISERAQLTLDGMNSLARYLSGVPGRKNLVWFAAAFPISLLPTGDSSGDPFARLVSSEHEFRETTNMLGRSQVSVYPIDSRGLMTDPMFNPANSTPGATSANPRRVVAAENNFSTVTFAEHQMMEEMATATGGKAFYNTNGIAQAIATSIDSGSNYYTLSYTPTDRKQDGSFRTIRVKIASLEGKSGYTVSYRQGYYSDESGGGARSASTPESPSAFHSATLYGAPPATQLLFRAIAQPVTKLPEETPATGNVLNKDPKDPAKTIASGPWNRYLIRYSVDGRPVEFTNDPNGAFHGDLEFITLVYDADGTLVNSQMNHLQPTLTPAQHAALEGHAMDITQQIGVPVKGNYNLRILVHDRNSGKLGSVEIPVSAARNLPPLQASKTPVP